MNQMISFSMHLVWKRRMTDAWITNNCTSILNIKQKNAMGLKGVLDLLAIYLKIFRNL